LEFLDGVANEIRSQVIGDVLVQLDAVRVYQRCGQAGTG
jgi:hypothetical protein